jgi:hypothetical protein
MLVYVFLIAKYPVMEYFNAKVMMYEYVLVTKETIYVYLSLIWNTYFTENKGENP